MKGLFIILSLLVVALCFVPLVSLGTRLLSRSGYLNLLWEAENVAAVGVTLRVSLSALVVALALAIPLSFLIVRTDILGRQWFRKIFLFPYMLPPYLFAIAWTMLAIPKVGFLNRAWGDWLNVYSHGGLIWVFATAYLPILLASLCQALESMDPALEEAARVSGATPFQTLRRITFPCILPMVSASSLLFLLAVLAAFGVPALIGEPARIYVLTTKIYTYAKLGGLSGTDQAFAISLWLFLITLGFLFIQFYIRKHFGARLVVGKVSRQSQVRLGRWRLASTTIVALSAAIIVIIPLLAIVLGSFLRVAGDLSLSNFTLDNYRFLFFQTSEFYPAIWNSIWMALAGGILCVGVAFFLAYFNDRTDLPFRKSLNAVATFPYAIPGAVIVLALIVSWGTGWGIAEIALIGSPVLMVMAYFIKYLGISVQNLASAIATIHKSLDEAASVSGAGPWRVLFQIVFPLLWPVLIHVWILTVLPIMSELTMSVLLTGPGLETVGTLLFQLQEYANPQAACSLATILVIFFSFVLFLLHQLNKKGRLSHG